MSETLTQKIARLRRMQIALAETAARDDRFTAALDRVNDQIEALEKAAQAAQRAID